MATETILGWPLWAWALNIGIILLLTLIDSMTGRRNVGQGGTIILGLVAWLITWAVVAAV